MKNHWHKLSYVLFSSAAMIVLFAAVQLVSLPFRLTEKKSKPFGDEILPGEWSQLEPLEHYQNAFASHALFSKPIAQGRQQSSPLSELLRPYVLTGIIQGANPEVLIRNTVTRQMNFLQAGEQFDQFKLMQIKQHSVIVEYQGEQRELHIEEIKS